MSSLRAVPVTVLVAFTACTPGVTKSPAPGGGGGPTVDTGEGSGDDTGSSTGDDPVDRTEVVYALDQFSHFELELDPDDWESLRTETRNAFDILLGDCQAEPFESPFQWYEAELSIDGEYIGTIEARKKGFLGSLNEDKPSLKLDLVEFDDDLDHHGVERFTLNNAISDPSLVRQCVGYGVFLDVGIPAPRCNFARVSVNGDDLGVYVNVEPVKEPFLERHFADPTGDLYEGTLADFREGWTGTLERKTNEDSEDWSSVEGVVAALEGPDDRLIDALAEEIDLDNWFTFWATEVMVTHIDGYAGNTNNYFVYDDPERDKLVFMPWGIDAILLPAGWREAYPDSVYASGALANRLYNHPEGQDLYLDALDDVLDTAWNEDVLLERIDDMEAVLAPELGADEREVTRQIDVVRSVVERRRNEVVSELSDGPVAWDVPMRDSFCFSDVGSVSASFSTTWGTISTEDPYTFGDASLVLTVEDESFAPEPVGATAGQVASTGQHLLYMAAWLNDHEAVFVYLEALPEVLVPGELELDFETATAAVFYIDTETMTEFELHSYIVGSFTFSALSLERDSPVVGTLDGVLISF